MKKYSILVFLAIIGISCQKWTETEREVFDNQTNLKRLVTLMEAQKEEDLNESMREHYKKIREYRNQPRVKGFGWFGNWTAKGNNPQNYLRTLPDSVDLVSVWGTKGKLSQEQQADLKFFQDVKGGKAFLCWIVEDTGAQLTPTGKTDQQYWLQEKGGGDKVKAAVAYADAIADTIIKYDFDGFDIDLESGYGHHSRWSEIAPITRPKIDQQNNPVMYAFIKTLYDRFKEEENKGGRARMILMDGEPHLLSTETSKMIDHYIYQAYWENHTSTVISKISHSHLTDWERKTIITVEFEQGWRTGGIHPESGAANPAGRGTYTSVRPELNGIKGGQILDYATMDLPSGKRIGGVGTYHMEYDYPNNPEYKWIRKALYYGNQVYKGNYQ